MHNYDLKYILNILKVNKNIVLFYIQYNLYCNELEMYKYISKTIDNAIIDYYRKQLSNKRKRLKQIEPKETLIEKVYKKYKGTNIKELIDFLELFFENNKVLSEKEVARKLNISRQALNKRKNKLFNKYKQDI